MSTAPHPIPVGAEPPPLDTAPRRVGTGGRADRLKRKPKPGHGGGRFGVLNGFVDMTLRCIGPTAAVVWLVLFRDTKPDGLARTSPPML